MSPVVSRRQGRRSPALRLLLLVVLALGGVTLAAAQQPAPPPAQTQTPAQPQAEETQPARAPATIPPELLEPVQKLSSAMDEAEKAVQHIAGVEDDLRKLRNDAEEILSQSTTAADDLRPQLASVKALIEKLGPPPAKDQPAEAPAIAAERERLNKLAAQIDGAIKSTELTWARARQLIERITVMRHSIFTKNLMERLHSPLLPQVWRDLSSQMPVLTGRIAYQSSDWMHWAGLKSTQLFLLLGAAIVVLLVFSWGVRRFTKRYRARWQAPPSFFERGMSIAWTAPLRALPVIAAATLVYAGLDVLDLLYQPWSRVGAATYGAILEITVLVALISAVLAPGRPHWRIVPLDDPSARRLARIFYWMMAIYVFNNALSEYSRAFLAPLTFTVVQSFAASVLFAGFLMAVALTPFAPQPVEDAPPETEARILGNGVSRNSPLWLKLPLWLLALGIIFAATLGYVALARFLTQQIVLTGMVVAVVWLLYLAIRAFTREPPRQTYPVTEVLETRFGLDESRRRQLARLTEAALTLALIICAIPVLMLQWGFSANDIRDGFKALLFGIEIGSFKISLARILIGIVLFIALLFTTRLFQHWLRENALKETRLDQGIVDSIDTVVGYAGIAIAGLIAVSYAGFDITNLAIVAGALSVGIGFGLQSIVNNFVSGLILLIERPIKVGDRIAVGNELGLVRRISVRSTEVETFDRSSLIIPNSELITGRVLNWTHRNRMAAVNVKVSTSYATDPEAVLTILKASAEAHPEVLTQPAPTALFEGFGDSGLLFNLRISLADVDRALGVQSDLRVAILKEFRAKGIEIPFNTVDVNLRDLDTVKRFATRLMEERAAQKAAEAAKEVAEPQEEPAPR